MHKDFRRIERFAISKEYYIKTVKRINQSIENLKIMPRIHKTIFYYANPEIEYRRIIVGKYIIVYKIVDSQIIILRIFNQKENYLNQRRFILREKSQKYVVIRK